MMSRLLERKTNVNQNRHMSELSFTHVMKVDASYGHSAVYVHSNQQAALSHAAFTMAVFMNRPPMEGLLAYSTFLLIATEAAGFSCQAEIT